MIVDITLVQNLVKTLASEVLLPRFNCVDSHYKADGSIVTEADLLMQAALSQALTQHYPDIALLSEEMEPAEQQQLFDSGQSLWCLDPIDGTTNFASGLPFFCVSLALIVDRELVFGLVYDPIRDECFSAYQHHGAYLNQTRLSTADSITSLKKAIAFIDYKRLLPDLRQRVIDEQPFGSHRHLGSIALELCWLSIGRGHVYLHNRQNLWDYAAALVVLTELGIPIQSFSGNPVFDGRLTPRPTVAAVNPALFDAWLHCLDLK